MGTILAIFIALATYSVSDNSYSTANTECDCQTEQNITNHDIDGNITSHDIDGN